MLLLLEERLPLPLCAERRAINQDPHGGIRARIREQVQMFFSAAVFTAKTEQLEQKRPALSIGRVITQLGAQHLDRFLQMPFM